MPPKYRIIADELRNQIQNGNYSDAKVLPTEFTLAEEYQVSRQTIRQALSLLVEQGMIEKRQGSGSHIHREMVQETLPASRNIAVVTTYISDYIFPSILREVENVLARNNCTPTLYATQNQVSSERRILSTLLTTQVDGILVEGTKTALHNPNLDLYGQRLEREVPLVFMNGNYASLPQALYVLDDNGGGGRMLVEYLFRKGHRSIAGVFKSDDIQGHQRYAGFTDALRDLGLPLEDRNMLWYNTEDIIKFDSSNFLPEMLRVMDGCSAVVCYNDEVAFRLVRQLLAKGMKIPEEMAIVSFDNSQYSDLSPVRITSLSHEENNVGRLAAEMLIRLMEGKHCQSLLAPWVLMEKESS